MIVILKQNEGKDHIETNGIKNILHNHNAILIDGSMLPDMAKIEVATRNIVKLKSILGEGWEIFPEKKYAVPNTRRKIRE